jgi:hypothetical protein
MSEQPLKDQISLERYKYLLSKIQFLDSSLYKNIDFASKFIISACSVVFATIMAYKAEKIDLISLQLGLLSISYIISFVCIIFVAITVSILLSWKDYRNEEVALLKKLDIDIGRKPPTYNNFMRWTESWFIVGLLLIFVLSIFLEPMITKLIT